MRKSPSKGMNLNLNLNNFDFHKDFSPNNKDHVDDLPPKKEKPTKGLEKYRSNSFVSKLNFYMKKFNFSEKELLMIKKRYFIHLISFLSNLETILFRFNKISFKGNITKMKFRESLGVLGLENITKLIISI